MKKSGGGGSTSGKRTTNRVKRVGTTCEQPDKTGICTTDLQRVQFVVHGEPVGQPRHRVSTIGGRGRLYLPKSHPVHSYKAAIRAAFIEAAGKWRTITGPVRLSVVAKFAMPASWSKKQTEATAGAVCMKTPDHDNIAKSVSDALTDCGVWQDDRQVVVSLVSKYWSEQPQTEITIEELPWNG